MTAPGEGPPPPGTPARRPPVWLLVSAAWLGPAILAALKEYAQGRLGEPGTPNWTNVAFEGLDWLLYALLTPAVWWLARRFRLERGAVIRRLPLHFAAAILLCAGWSGGGVLLGRALYREFVGPLGWFLTSLPFGVAVYFAVLGVEHATHYFREARERETQAARLAAQLALARLGALRMQMQPHFLFNTLNAITVVLRDRDTATAARLLEQLGEMLRRVMRTDRPQEVTLEEELDFTRRYLAIEEVRFSDRLHPEFDVDPGLLGAAVPEFVLQPLVENAVRHGLARRETAALLRVEARREGADLVLSVIDDGPGPGELVDRSGEGVGLANIRERLATLYGGGARLELVRTADGGARATVRLPYREAAPSHA